MNKEEIKKKLSICIFDLYKAKGHLEEHPEAAQPVSNVESAIRHLNIASQDLLSLFALLPEELHPTLKDLREMGFKIRHLHKPPHAPNLEYMKIVDDAFASFKRSQAAASAS